jgi:hypothetical protein
VNLHPSARQLREASASSQRQHDLLDCYETNVDELDRGRDFNGACAIRKQGRSSR